MAARPEINQAVIFAGGRGERLRPLTDRLPKPMAPVYGRPFLDYLLQTLMDTGIMSAVILAGYRADIIMDRYKDGLRNGFKVRYSIGSVDNLTGRRVLDAYNLLEDEFLLMYGDNYWPIEMARMLAHYGQKQVPAMTTVFSNTQGSAEYGFENNVRVENGMVKRYDKKRQAPSLNGVDIGYFVLRKDILDQGISGNISFEEDVLARMARQGRLAAHVTDRQYYYITSFATLKNFEAAVTEHQFKPLDENLLK